MSTLSPPERNAPCPCGSNKKYKKCCANSFIVKYNTLSEEELQSSFPKLSADDDALLIKLHAEIEKKPELLSSEECEYIKKLFTIRDNNPLNPTIANYIVDAYAKLNLEDKMYATIKENYEKFPTYLPAITAEVLACLNNNLIERAHQILGPYNQIKELYPTRTTFHISEVSLFAHSKVQYACKIDNLEEATNHLNTLRTIHKEGKDPLYVDAQNAVALLKARLR